MAPTSTHVTHNKNWDDTGAAAAAAAAKHTHAQQSISVSSRRRRGAWRRGRWACACWLAVCGLLGLAHIPPVHESHRPRLADLGGLTGQHQTPAASSSSSGSGSPSGSGILGAVVPAHPRATHLRAHIPGSDSQAAPGSRSGSSSSGGVLAPVITARTGPLSQVLAPDQCQQHSQQRASWGRTAWPRSSPREASTAQGKGTFTHAGRRPVGGVCLSYITVASWRRSRGEALCGRRRSLLSSLLNLEVEKP